MGHIRRASKELVLGVDIGGTKVAAGLVDSRGRVIFSKRGAMAARGSAAQGLNAVHEVIAGVMADSRAANVQKIGACVPGWLDLRRGIVLSAANLPCWRNYPLMQKMEKLYGLPVRLANDANAAALAEARWGAARGYESAFYVTLGTGIGTAIILHGGIYDGPLGAAGEGGHMTIDLRGPLCGCGKRGCIEVYASGTAIAKRARARLRNGRGGQSLILKMADGNPSRITGEVVSKAAIVGDRLAKQVLTEAADYLAIWLSNIVDLLAPQVIILGGGLGPVISTLRSRIQHKLFARSMHPRQHHTSIINARYGAESALIGAAAQCFEPAKR